MPKFPLKVRRLLKGKSLRPNKAFWDWIVHFIMNSGIRKFTGEIRAKKVKGANVYGGVYTENRHDRGISYVAKSSRLSVHVDKPTNQAIGFDSFSTFSTSFPVQFNSLANQVVLSIRVQS